MLFLIPQCARMLPTLTQLHLLNKSEFQFWHNKLGHSSKSTMAHIPELAHCVKGQEQVCFTCPHSKFIQLPYELSHSHASKPFELLHLETWGPYRISTQGKFRYFLTLVDDFSRMSRVYLMTNKSDFLEIFKMFFQYVLTHFNTSIQILRSDNALEFQDSHCRKFYARHGILHQISCPRRPQQNSRVERKHRQILEIARALKITVRFRCYVLG